MKAARSFKILGFIILSFAIFPSAYGQESLPDTVQRHNEEIGRLEQEINRISGELQNLKKRLEPISVEGNGNGNGDRTFVEKEKVALYISAPGFIEESSEISSNRRGCKILEAQLFINDVGKQLVGVVKSSVRPDALVPYHVDVMIGCPYDVKLECRGSGMIDVSRGHVHKVVVTRIERHVCKAEIVSSV